MRVSKLKISILLLCFVYITIASAMLAHSLEENAIFVDEFAYEFAYEPNSNIDDRLMEIMNHGLDLDVPIIIEFEKSHENNIEYNSIISLLNQNQVYDIERYSNNSISLIVPIELIYDISNHIGVNKIWLNENIDVDNNINNNTIQDNVIPSSIPLKNYGTTLIKAPKMWNAGYTGEGVVIAILDTGIDSTHPDLDDGKVILEKDFTNDNDVDDVHGHGTHIAGIIAGDKNIEMGMSGIAPNASLLNIKVINNTGFGQISWVVDGINYAMENDADIISISFVNWQDDGTGNDRLSKAVANAVANGHIVVASAGNLGPGIFTIARPAIVEGVISVAASNSNNNIAKFSSRGPTGYGRIGIDLVAPGVRIISANYNWEAGNLHAYNSGTSMATPHVVGAIALLLQSDPSLTHREIKSALKTSANNLFVCILEQGAGKINVKGAYDMLSDGISISDNEWFIGKVDAGVFTKSFIITNNNMEEDAILSINDNFMTTVQGDKMGDWISIDAQNIIVPAGKFKTITATMNVPNTAKGVYISNFELKGTVGTQLIDVITPLSVNVMQGVYADSISHITGTVDVGSNGVEYEGDWIYYILDIREEIQQLHLNLNWAGDSDLNMILFDPNNRDIKAKEISGFEDIVIKNPILGKWVIAINAWSLTAEESYNLKIVA